MFTNITCNKCSLIIENGPGKIQEKYSGSYHGKEYLFVAISQNWWPVTRATAAFRQLARHQCRLLQLPFYNLLLTFAIVFSLEPLHYADYSRHCHSIQAQYRVKADLVRTKNSKLISARKKIAYSCEYFLLEGRNVSVAIIEEKIFDKSRDEPRLRDIFKSLQTYKVWTIKFRCFVYLTMTPGRRSDVELL